MLLKMNVGKSFFFIKYVQYLLSEKLREVKKTGINRFIVGKVKYLLSEKLLINKITTTFIVGKVVLSTKLLQYLLSEKFKNFRKWGRTIIAKEKNSMHLFMKA